MRKNGHHSTVGVVNRRTDYHKGCSTVVAAVEEAVVVAAEVVVEIDAVGIGGGIGCSSTGHCYSNTGEEEEEEEAAAAVVEGYFAGDVAAVGYSFGHKDSDDKDLVHPPSLPLQVGLRVHQVVSHLTCFRIAAAGLLVL